MDKQKISVKTLLTQYIVPGYATILEFRVQGKQIGTMYSDSPVLELLADKTVIDWFVTTDTEGQVIYIELDW